MVKHKILFLFLLFSTICFISKGQNTTSPYSIFGPGEIQAKGFGKLKGMGSAGLALKSKYYLNNLNPASYTGIDSLHYIYTAGVEGKFSLFEQQNKTKSDVAANIKYLALGFRVDKWWFTSIGLIPFTNVGFEIITQNYIEGSSERYISQHTGSGGINQVYWANAFKLTKNLSVGINSSYMFGSVIHDEIVSQPVLNSTYLVSRKDYLNSLYFDYGLQYSFKVKNIDYSLGLVYSQKQSLNSRNVVTVASEGNSGYNNILANDEKKLDYIEVPNTFGAGVAIQNGFKYTLAIDYHYQNWANVRYPTQADNFVDAHNFVIGAEFRPWAPSVTNKGFKNWVFRAGLNYNSSYLEIGNRLLDEKSISLGVGIPLKNEKARNVGSAINVALEFGTKGTTQNNQVREDFFRLHMNFSINEIWFQKRQYF